MELSLMRHRLRDGTVATPAVHTIRRAQMSNSSEVLQTGLVGPYDDMYDVVVPNFHKRRDAGEVFFNPMSSSRSTNTMNPGKVRWRYKYADTAGRPTGEYWEGWWEHPLCAALGRVEAPAAIPLTDPELQSARTAAITEALASVGRPEFLGAVALAEAEKTLAMLRDPLGRLLQGLHHLLDGIVRVKRGQYERAVRRSWDLERDVASEWLRYRYGIMPAIYDVQDLLSALRKKHADRETVRATRAVVPRITTASGSAYVQSTPLSGRVNLGYTVTDTNTATVRASILTRYDAAIQTDFGFGLLDTPQAVWELIPFSFVVDWVTNLGSFVESLRLGASSRHLVRSVSIERISTRQRVSTSATPWSGWGPDWSVYHDAASSDYATRTYKVRESFDLDDRGVVWQPRLSTERVLDAIALLTGPMDKVTRAIARL